MIRYPAGHRVGFYGERYLLLGYFEGTSETSDGHRYVHYKRGRICTNHFLVDAIDPVYDLCPNCFYRAKKQSAIEKEKIK